MSLTREQKKNTIEEFQQNLEISGLTLDEIANSLGTDELTIKNILQLNMKHLEDTWILKNYLIKKIKEIHKTPVPFTALVGDYHDYWFLNSEFIDKGKIR
ncbi:DUF2316 family protein [Terrisporobacter sp.]